MNNKIIAICFDGTLCENKYPDIGEPRKDVIAKLLKEQQEGAKTILITERRGEELLAAIYWAFTEGITFDEVTDDFYKIADLIDEYWDENADFNSVNIWKRIAERKKIEAEITEKIRKDVIGIIDRRLDIVEIARSPDLGRIIISELNCIQRDITNYFGKIHNEREGSVNGRT